MDKVKLKKHNEYLYEIKYDKLYPSYAEELCRKRYIPTGACSAIRFGQFHGRNYDWTYDDAVEFIVRVSGNGIRHASIGVATGSGILDKALIESRKYDENYKMLPFRTLDGINDAGVVVNTNVVPTTEFPRTTGTNPTADDLCAMTVCRFILDNADSVDDAVEKLKTRNIWCPISKKMDEEFHWMISDSTKTVVIEIIDNKINVLDERIMTNFYLTNFDHSEMRLPKRADGIERYNILRDNQKMATSIDAMAELMSKVWYSKAYDLSMDPFWKSEFAGLTDEQIAGLAELYKVRKRSGNKYPVWQTVHTSVYDLVNKTMTVLPQETKKKYTFTIDGKDLRNNNLDRLLYTWDHTTTEN